MVQLTALSILKNW